LACPVDHHWQGIGVLCCHAANVSDEASATHIHAGYATPNTDHIIRCAHTTARTSAQGDIEAAARAVFERAKTDGRIAFAGGVIIQRTKSGSGVCGAGGVIIECSSTGGRVVSAGGVGTERTRTDGRIAFAGGVFIERAVTGGRVIVAGGVMNERFSPGGRVSEAVRIQKHSLKTNGREKYSISAKEIAQSLVYETNAASDLRRQFDEPLCSSVQQDPAYIRICSSTGSSSDGRARAEQSAAAFPRSASFDLGY
jgi:hypothetical protein